MCKFNFEHISVSDYTSIDPGQISNLFFVTFKLGDLPPYLKNAKLIQISTVVLGRVHYNQPLK